MGIRSKGNSNTIEMEGYFFIDGQDRNLDR